MTASIGRVMGHLQDRPKPIGNLAKSLVKDWQLLISNRHMMMMVIKKRRLMSKKELIKVEGTTTNPYISLPRPNIQ
jgi:hypothetical protein